MIEMVKVVGDALAVFEELTQPVRLILRNHVYSATVENYNYGGYYDNTHRNGSVKMIRLCVGGRTLSHVESVPLLPGEVAEVMSWLAGAPWPPDEIASITEAKARYAAWVAWEQENAKS